MTMKNPFDLLTEEQLLEGDHPPRADQYEWREGELATVKKTRNSVYNGPPMRVRIERAWWGPGTGYRMVEVTDLDTGKRHTTFGDNLVKPGLPTPTAPVATATDASTTTTTTTTTATAAPAAVVPTPVTAVIEMPPARVIPPAPPIPGV